MMKQTPLHHDNVYLLEQGSSFVGKRRIDQTNATSLFGSFAGAGCEPCDNNMEDDATATTIGSTSSWYGSSSPIAPPKPFYLQSPLYASPGVASMHAGVGAGYQEDPESTCSYCIVPPQHKKQKSTDSSSSSFSSSSLPRSPFQKKSGHRKRNGFTGQDFERLILSQF